MVYPETSVRNYHCKLHDVPEERRFHLPRGGSMKALIRVDCPYPDWLCLEASHFSHWSVALCWSLHS